MAISAIDPVTRLAFSMFENKGVGLVLCRVLLVLRGHAYVLRRAHGAFGVAFVLNAVSVHLARNSLPPSRGGHTGGVVTTAGKVFSHFGLKTSVQNRKRISSK